MDPWWVYECVGWCARVLVKYRNETLQMCDMAQNGAVLLTGYMLLKRLRDENPRVPCAPAQESSQVSHFGKSACQIMT